jgi:hypothetical protein
MVGMLIDPDTGDLQVKDGALALGDNTEQVAECVLLAARGELKEHPLVGAEITKLANGNGATTRNRCSKRAGFRFRAFRSTTTA